MAMKWLALRGFFTCPPCKYEQHGEVVLSSDLATGRDMFRCPRCGRQYWRAGETDVFSDHPSDTPTFSLRIETDDPTC